jgi:hypothetical protein
MFCSVGPANGFYLLLDGGGFRKTGFPFESAYPLSGNKVQ